MYLSWISHVNFNQNFYIGCLPSDWKYLIRCRSLSWSLLVTDCNSAGDVFRNHLENIPCVPRQPNVDAPLIHNINHALDVFPILKIYRYNTRIRSQLPVTPQLNLKTHDILPTGNPNPQELTDAKAAPVASSTDYTTTTRPALCELPSWSLRDPSNELREEPFYSSLNCPLNGKEELYMTTTPSWHFETTSFNTCSTTDYSTTTTTAVCTTSTS